MFPTIRGRKNRRGNGPRGRITGTTAPQVVNNLTPTVVVERGKRTLTVPPVSIVVSGYRPTLLVTVKTGSVRHRREFERFCALRGIRAFVAHQVCPDGVHGHQTVYECSGTGPALEELSVRDFVVGWCYPLDVKAPNPVLPSTFRRV